MSSDLGDFFSLIGEAKKKEEKKTKDIIGEVSLDNLFSSLAEEKKKIKEAEVEKDKEREKLIKDAKIFESFLFSEVKKPVKEEVNTTNWKDDYKPLEVETEDIITPEPLEPTEGIGSEIVSKEESTIEKSLEILEQLIPEEEQVNESETEMARMKREVDQLRKMLYETIQKVEVQGGGGEVRLEFLDDVDRDSIKQNNKFIKYDSSTQSFVGADAGTTVDLGPLTNIAAASSGSIPQGATLSFDAASGQFITTTAIGAATTNIGGYPITGANPQDNNVITFNSDTGEWEYDSPFTIVDLSDGVQDGHQDYGSFS